MTDAAQNQAQIVFFLILPSSLVCHIQLTKISSQHLYHSRLATDVARDKVTELSNMRRPCQSSLTAATRPQTSDTHRHIAITGQHTEYVMSRHDQTHAVRHVTFTAVLHLDCTLHQKYTQTHEW